MTRRPSKGRIIIVHREKCDCSIMAFRLNSRETPQPVMPDDFNYDVFLNHRSRQDGGAWIGGAAVQFARTAQRTSEFILPSVSPHAFESAWAALASAMFPFRNLANQECDFMPLRLNADAKMQNSHEAWPPKSQTSSESS